ncbi:Polyadenylate-binding protein 2 [Platanthera guangdongensis]|uniref:Polyadenylate-binding protein 2 n=1 Tax=Platanthera guangdongensis TaxID=2320717 RepID=A0ABR2M1C0_9ASPA
MGEIHVYANFFVLLNRTCGVEHVYVHVITLNMGEIHVYAEEDLAKIFGEYGRTTSIIVMRDLDGKSKCFGFVNFENPDDAATAVQELNGNKMEDKEWYVGRAQKKTEREQELKTRFEQSITGTADKYQWVNLYLKNLDDSIGDEKLNELFSVRVRAQRPRLVSTPKRFSMCLPSFELKMFYLARLSRYRIYLSSTLVISTTVLAIDLRN